MNMSPDYRQHVIDLQQELKIVISDYINKNMLGPVECSKMFNFLLSVHMSSLATQMHILAELAYEASGHHKYTNEIKKFLDHMDESIIEIIGGTMEYEIRETVEH